MRAMESYFDKFSSPYIVFQPGVEKYIDVFASLDLEEASPSKDKTTVYCENMWHAAFYEEEICGIAWQTAQWLKARI